MNLDPLFELVINELVFLELSDDETINQDSAVRQMEFISACLHRLDEPTLRQFLAYVSRAAQESRQNYASKKQIAFIESIPESFGLLD